MCRPEAFAHHDESSESTLLCAFTLYRFGMPYYACAIEVRINHSPRKMPVLMCTTLGSKGPCLSRGHNLCIVFSRVVWKVVGEMEGVCKRMRSLKR
jgi:hypothetical protein